MKQALGLCFKLLPSKITRQIADLIACRPVSTLSMLKQDNSDFMISFPLFNRPVTITTIVGQYIAPEISVINDIIVILSKYTLSRSD